jgi:ABC-type amino acid transport substrate-binding protein
MTMKLKVGIIALIVLLVAVGSWLILGKHQIAKETGYTIAVVTGTTFEQRARMFKNVREVKLYEDDNQTLSELTNGRVDAVITDRLVGIIGIQEGGYTDLQLTGDLLYRETIAVAFNQEDKALRQAVNQALARIINNGTYAEISQKYFGQNILEGLEIGITHPDEPEAADGSWERVKRAGEVRFAMSGGYPPFNYYNDQNQLTGFDVEIAQAVCEELGVKYIPVTTAWDGIIEGLRAKRYDGVWGSMAITEERLKVVDFSDPYYLSGAQLLVKKGSFIKGPESLD